MNLIDLEDLIKETLAEAMPEATLSVALSKTGEVVILTGLTEEEDTGELTSLEMDPDDEDLDVISPNRARIYLERVK